MRIIAAAGEFELPIGFEAELSRNNVLLTAAGEQTQPITLPGIPNNLKLVGYSDRIDSYYKPLTDLDVIVSDGLFNRPCNLGIHSANEEDGISATIYLGTGDFYSRVGNTRLNWLGWPVVKSPTFDTDTLANQVLYLINILKSEYNAPSGESIFRMAPVSTTQEFTWFVHRLKGDGTYEDVDVTGLFTLNGFERYQHSLELSESGEGELTVFEGEYPQQLKIDGNTIDMSTGYGMTPFLKVRYMVSFIFSKFGYSYDSRDLEENINEYADDIVMINNVADAIYGGILNFNKLVPDVTIKAFLAEVEKTFVGKFVLNEVTKTVLFCRYEDYLNRIAPDVDLSEYACSKSKLGAMDFTSIQIKDNADSTTTADEANEKSVTIDFDFVKQVLVTASYTAPAVTGKSIDVTLKMVQIDNIVHVNSTVKVTGKTSTEEKPAVSSIVQFMNVKNLLVTASSSISGVAIGYKRSYRLFTGLFDEDTETPLNAVDSFYTDYKLFRSNSNVPIELDMLIPEQIMEQLDLQMPKLLHGQRVMIESLVQKLGKKSTVPVKLRTLRPFVSR